jgi:hypothetical protein
MVSFGFILRAYPRVKHGGRGERLGVLDRLPHVWSADLRGAGQKEDQHVTWSRIRGSERSPLPRAVRNRPRTSVFRSSFAELRTEKDSMAEGSEFELPVPVSKLSDDNVVL